MVKEKDFFSIMSHMYFIIFDADISLSSHIRSCKVDNQIQIVFSERTLKNQIRNLGAVKAKSFSIKQLTG